MANERLARALLPKAIEALGTLSVSDRASALDVLRAFIDNPGPAAFLAARRALWEPRCAQTIQASVAGLTKRGMDRGIRALRATASLPEAAIGILADALPVDRRSGDRLDALAALIVVCEELAGRVQADTHRLRRRLRAPTRPRSRRR